MGLDHQIDSGLDRNRIEALSCDLLEHIRANYKAGPISRDRVYEALNALAFCVATVVEGSDGAQGEAHDFFRRAYAMQCADLREHPPLHSECRNL
jgi:hypothetical protein